MASNRTGSPWRIALNQYQYVVAVCVLLLVILLTHRISGITEQFLSQTFDSQQRIRAIIKINLIFQRGFALGLLALESGDKDLFHEALDLIESSRGYLSTKDYLPPKKEALISSRIDRIVDELERVFSGYSVKGLPVPEEMIDGLRKKPDEVFGALAEEDVANWNRLSENNSQLERSFRQTRKLLIALHVLMFFLLAVLALIMSGKARAERALKETHAGLEKRVEERTSELAAANVVLESEISERKRAEEERRELEAQVQHAQKLESLGILAGGIAHDFNNLLMGILGNSELAMLKMPAASPARDYLKKVLKSSEQAAELVKQLLAYSGKGNFVVESVDLKDLVKDIADLLKVSISKKTAMRFDFSEESTVMEADVAQIRQVVMNLITNASEAIGEEGGVITVSVGHVDADRHYLTEVYSKEQVPEGRYVYLGVADTGCGMSDETKAKLFEPFFSTKIFGRGLGMAAVQGIVRGHRGTIRVYSEEGKGSSIKVLLPGSGKSPAATPFEALRRKEWKGQGTILVVDDEATVCDVASGMLEEIGFGVMTARDGKEGVEIFRSHHDEISAVILDMNMPRMNGEEAFREMRKIREDVKIILSSGYSEQHATGRFAGRGMVGFIQKPFSIDVLREKLRGVVEV